MRLYTKTCTRDEGVTVHRNRVSFTPPSPNRACTTVPNLVGSSTSDSLAAHGPLSRQLQAWFSRALG